MAKRKKAREEERYQLTPKGLASVALMQCGLLQSLDDPRFEGFWAIFHDGMKQNGYIVEEDGDGYQGQLGQ